MEEQKNNNLKESKQIDELSKLKEKIIKREMEPKKEKNKLFWDSGLVTAILIILVATATLQSLESKAILAKIESGNLKSNTSSTSALPSSLDSLPNMVGGC